jgi:pimeloyl-[acyl-carrier protein] methyl ester esterase
VISYTVIHYDNEVSMDYDALEVSIRKQLPRERPFVILGESFSGPIAISIAAAPPENLIGVIFVCTFVRNPQPMLTWLKRFIRFMPIKSAPKSAMEYFILGSHGTASLNKMLRAAIDQVSEEVLRFRAELVLDVDYTKLIDKISLPCLYLFAKRDRVVPSGSSKFMFDRLSNVRVEEMDAPHFLLQVEPVQAAKLIEKYITSLTDEIE